jgi:hypothetical protein
MKLLVSGSTRSVAGLAPSWPDRLGHLLTPSNRNSMAAILKTGLSWAVDNGAYSGFDPVAFRRLLRKVAGQPRLLWIACPDVVADARGTIALFREWEEKVRQAGPIAFILQDGQEDLPIPEADAYFIGGSTGWKLSEAAADVATEAKWRGCGAWLHMGRVNSRRRMEVAADLGCDSIDGSSASMYGDTYIHKYLQWLSVIDRQRVMF